MAAAECWGGLCWMLLRQFEKLLLDAGGEKGRHNAHCTEGQSADDTLEGAEFHGTRRVRSEDDWAECRPVMV